MHIIVRLLTIVKYADSVLLLAESLVLDLHKMINHYTYIPLVDVSLILMQILQSLVLTVSFHNMQEKSVIYLLIGTIIN